MSPCSFWFRLVPLAVSWVLTAIRAAGHLTGWLVTRAAAPWRLQEGAEREEPDPARELRHFGTRVGQEISRVKQQSGPSLSVVTVGVKVCQPALRPGLQQLIWQCARQSARHHYLLHRTEQGDMLALLPDTDPLEVERWCASFRELDADAAVGCAAYPADGETADALIERAVTRMWLDQGAAAGELVSVSSSRHKGPIELSAPPARPTGPQMSVESSCIPLGDDDIILDSAADEPLFDMSRRLPLRALPHT